MFSLSIGNPATKKKEQTATLSCIYDIVRTWLTIISSGQCHRFWLAVNELTCSTFSSINMQQHAIWIKTWVSKLSLPKKKLKSCFLPQFIPLVILHRQNGATCYFIQYISHCKNLIHNYVYWALYRFSHAVNEMTYSTYNCVHIFNNIEYK